MKVENGNTNPANPPGVTVGYTTISGGDKVLFVSGIDTTLLAFAHNGSFQKRPDNECASPHYRAGVTPPVQPVAGNGNGKKASETVTTTPSCDFDKFLLATVTTASTPPKQNGTVIFFKN